jgi:hypothetical protein
MTFEDIEGGVQKVTLEDGSLRYRFGKESAELWLTEAQARQQAVTNSTRPTKINE